MTNPRRGITFQCPCGCEKEYGVPLPDGWLLVPDDVDEASQKAFAAAVFTISPHQAYDIERTARIAIKSFLQFHGSTVAKGVQKYG